MSLGDWGTREFDPNLKASLSRPDVSFAPSSNYWIFKGSSRTDLAQVIKTVPKDVDLSWLQSDDDDDDDDDDMLVVESSDGEQGASSAIDVQDQYLGLESEVKQQELQMEVQQKRKLPAPKRKRKDLSPDSEDDRAPISSRITKNGLIVIDFSDDEQTLGELVPEKKAEEGPSTAPDSDDCAMDQGAYLALSLVHSFLANLL